MNRVQYDRFKSVLQLCMLCLVWFPMRRCRGYVFGIVPFGVQSIDVAWVVRELCFPCLCNCEPVVVTGVVVVDCDC